MNIIKSILHAWRSIHLMVRIFCGIVIGSILALTCPDINGITILGTLFVGALKAVAPLLVAVLVIASVAKAREGLGERFRTVIILYMASTLIAAVVAVFASELFPLKLVFAGSDSVAADAAPAALADVFNKLARDLMSNPVSAVSTASYLSVLFWAIVMGLALKKTATEKTVNMIQEIADAISLVVSWIIQFAPFGILGLVYASVTESGLEIFTTYGKLVLLLVGCMCTVSFIINPAISAFMLRKNPYPLVWRCLKGSAVSAFFTRSSAANLPVNMTLCKRMGLDEDFYSVSIPLGCTINMDGAAITITVMTLACCNTMGVDVSLASALLLSIMATLGACGSSGVAGGSLLLIPMSCALFGISNDVAMQVVGIGFIIGVIQDSVETALNSSGDVMFTATADYYDRMKKGEKIEL